MYFLCSCFLTLSEWNFVLIVVIANPQGHPFQTQAGRNTEHDVPVQAVTARNRVKEGNTGHGRLQLAAIDLQHIGFKKADQVLRCETLCATWQSAGYRESSSRNKSRRSRTS